ncbi:dipeptide ABC transporter ATP-binding protein [Xylophilus rhododendri]|uniref:Dipeptide ABC transporter ATP-binding protein n=1 Tax=Xylophilus rhododendri TaxID=2697032 RepID=A0A857JF55_9BURK|nr:ABC transporter ATP-binding protein [Xylophilus rhododendri]QHJ01316.1 dipeptide ABC transporter ATP-binding protein [Xylophilus rhododendri]
MSTAQPRDTAVLSLDRLTVALPPGADRAHAVQDLNLSLQAGEVLCLVGESGSGKSVAAAAVTRLLPGALPIISGGVLFDGQNLATLPESAMRRIRGAGIGMIFQEPMSALNPLMTIGQQLAEIFRAHTGLRRREIEARCLQLLQDVRIADPAAALQAHAHQLSGGQRQRAMIAMALALDPRVLVADEPTTALDVTTQAQILKLIRELQQRRGTAVLFITHDFGVVADIADRVAVMQHGRVVESGSAREVLGSPRHAYTRALLAAVPHGLPREPSPAASGEEVLAAEGLQKTYRSGSRWLRNQRVTHALDGVGLKLARGSTLGIVGESGSGKSTLARCLVGLLGSDGGRIQVAGRDAAPGPDPRVQMVFQDPYGSLDPRRRVGDSVIQGPLAQGVPRARAEAEAKEWFALVGLSPDALGRLPHEFSGGQRQRIGLARALAMKPEVLVADEPVSALDVSVQAQVLALLEDLRRRLGLSIVFITHDLRVAAQVCDRIAVMQHGRVVEEAATGELFRHPRHAYTRSLLAAMPGRARQDFPLAA